MKELKHTKPLISIVIPIYNEELCIGELCSQIKKLTSSINTYKFEIILVENGSFDNSYKLLLEERKKYKQLKIIQLAKNVGTDGGFIAGLTFAKGVAAVTLTGDLQDPADLILKFIDKWEKGYEIVYGIVLSRGGVKKIRKFQAFLFYKFIKLITNNLVKENASDYRLIDEKVYKFITSTPEHNKFLRGLTIWTGYKNIGITYKRLPRYAGKSKAYFSTVTKSAIDGIFSYSNIPFYVPLYTSLFFALITILFLLEGLFVIAFQSFFFTCCFIILAIILEYIRRIFIEVQNRPQFIIREKIGF